jgi:hypothetical protein
LLIRAVSQVAPAVVAIRAKAAPQHPEEPSFPQSAYDLHKARHLSLKLDI